MNQALVIRRLFFVLLLFILEAHQAVSLIEAPYVVTTPGDLKSIKDNVNQINNPQTHATYTQLSTDSSLPTSQAENQDTIESSETIVYNRFENPPTKYEDYPTLEEDPEGPPDHVIPHSEHEEARNVSTRPKYDGPGKWAKPSKEKEVQLEFVPTKLYAQVRGTHTVKRLPQREAVESAETEEEKENAPRLREVVTNSKVNTVYTEEGYEDSAYDHGGHIRDADFHEGFARKLREQMDIKHKSEGQDQNDEKDSRDLGRDYKKIDAEEFNDYDDDYHDHYETTTDLGRLADGKDVDNTAWGQTEVNPKLFTESGTQKLQEDLEREAAEIEKGVEINKIEKASSEEGAAGLAKSQRTYDQKESNAPKRRRYKKRKLSPAVRLHEDTSSGETNEPETNGVYSNYATTGSSLNTEIIPSDYEVHETTTLAEKGGSLFDDASNSSQFEESPSDSSSLINYHRLKNAKPKPVSYSQLFWDYFKSRQNPTTFETTSTDAATVSPHSTRKTVLSINGPGPYLHDEEDATTARAVESETFQSKRLFSPSTESTFFDNIPGYQSRKTKRKYSQTVNNHEPSIPSHNSSSLEKSHFDAPWPATTQVPLTEHSPLLNTFSETVAPIIPTTELEDTSEDEEMNRDTDHNSVYNSKLQDSHVMRRPRYKVLVRHDPKKLVESPKNHGKEVSTLIPAEEKLEEIPSTKNDRLNENYIKMLSYVRKNDQDKHYDLARHGQISDIILRNNEYDLNDLTRLRPPSPQKASEAVYYNFLPLRPRRLLVVDQPSMAIESETSREANWKDFPVSREQHRVRSSNSMNVPAHRFDPFMIVQPSWNDGRNLYPATELLPPAPLTSSEYSRYQPESEMGDYLIHTGNKLKEKNLSRAFRYSPITFEMIRRMRAKRRKRRSMGWERNYGAVSVDRVDDVKGVKVAAKNGTSNRDKMRRLGKNVDEKIERNSWRKVKRKVEAEFGPDMSSLLTKQSSEKKSILYENDYGIGSLESLHKESDVNERESDMALNGNNTKYGNNGKIVVSGKNEKMESADIKELFKNKVLNKELLKEETAKANDVRSLRRRRSPLEETNLRSEFSSKLQKNRKKKNEELLNESPKIVDDVIEKELNARFNEKENVGENKKEKVEVEVPDFDYVEELTEELTEDHADVTSTTESNLEFEKYPFYNNPRFSSAIKYATDPRRIPRKINGQMVFYNSRDAYKHCDEVDVNLDEALPQENEPVPDRGLKEDLPRLRGLGDKLDCFKAKYFDENPFDNPLFLEKSVEEPTSPPELNPTEFSSRISIFPKQNDEYVVQKLSRKPESTYPPPRKPATNFARLHGNRQSIRLNYERDPRTGRGRNSYFHSVRGLRNSNASRRPKKQAPKKHLVTTSPPSSSYSSPYQRQVYEDVMGNIKHMTNLYKASTTPSSQNFDSSNVQVKISNVPENSLKGHDNRSHLESTESFLDRDASKIEGLLPPKYSSSRNVNYRRNKAQKARASSLTPSSRIIGHYQKIQIHKRSVNDEFIDAAENSKGEKNDTATNGSLDRKRNQRIKSQGRYISHLAPEESTRSPIRRTKQSTALNNSTGKSTSRNISNSSNAGKEERNDETQKVYTIRDRIRYSKPKHDTNRVGKFAENETTVDHRRKEPRYNYIKRKKTEESSIETTTSLLNSTDEVPSTETDAATAVVTTDKAAELSEHLESQKLNVSEGTDTKSPSPEILDGSSKEHFNNKSYESLGSTRDSSNSREKENRTPITSYREPHEISRLKAFLETDPPGYSDSSPENLTFTSKNEDNSRDSDADRPVKQDDQGDYNASKSFYSDEESSEKLEKDSGSLPSKNSEESNESRVETFFKYNSRPSSPAENYEDEKYSDLGPRINKPAFYHPPFSLSGFARHENGDDSSKQSDQSKSSEEKEYTSPWYIKKEDEESSNKNSKYSSTNGFEFPWEKRERLASERIKRRNNKRKARYDEDVAANNRRRVYPWDRYDSVRSRWYGRNSDSEESSSENRPMKFSSRYSSKDRLPLGGNSSDRNDAEKISKSIEKLLEEDLEKGSDETDESYGKKSEPFVRNRGSSRKTAQEKDGLAKADKKSSEPSRELNEKKENDNVENKENNRNLERSESQIKLTDANREETDVNSNSAKRSKKRRKLSNNSIPVETSVKPVIEPANRNRRRQRPSIVTVATIVENTSAAAPTAASRISRRKVQKSIDDANRSVSRVTQRSKPKSDQSNRIVSTTPKSRTVEHRSKVSREKTVRRTIYPNEAKEKSSEQARTRQSKNLKSNKRINKQNRNDERNIFKNQSEEETSIEKERKLNRDERTRTMERNGFRGIFSRDGNDDFSGESSLGNFNLKNEEVKTLNDFGLPDSIPDDGDDNEFGGFLKPEDHEGSNNLQKESLKSIKNSKIDMNEVKRSNSVEGSINEIHKRNSEELKESMRNDEKGLEDEKEENKSESPVKFIKDPGQRLYYYVERRK